MVRRRKAASKPTPATQNPDPFLKSWRSIDYKDIIRDYKEKAEQVDANPLLERTHSRTKEFTGTTPDEFSLVTGSGAKYRVNIKTEKLEAKSIDTATIRELSRDVTGLFFDIADAINGDPEPFFYETETERETVKITVDLSMACTANTQNSLDRAREIMSIYETHRAKGDAVEIDFLFSVLITKTGEIFTVSIENAPVSELSILHFIACVPCFFRFALIDILTLDAQQHSATMTIIDHEEAKKHILPKLKGKGVYFSALWGPTNDMRYQKIDYNND